MIVELKEKICVIKREDGDPKYYGTLGARGESAFLAHVKRELVRQGHDVIKKRMVKDGHLVDELQQYIRTRNTKKDCGFAIYNNSFAIGGANEQFNRGQVILWVERF